MLRPKAQDANPDPKPTKKPEVVIVQRAVTEEFDKQELVNRREHLRNALTTPEPTDQELIDIGRANHPYYSINWDRIQTELSSLDQLLGE